MIHAIALRFGYVESNALSWLVFQAEFVAPKTRKEALLSLAEFLYKKFMGTRSYQSVMTKKCCKKSLDADSDNEFCSKCGDPIKDPGFDFDRWVNFLEGIRTTTIDGFGYSDDTENPYGWDPSLFAFGIPDKNMIIVAENAAEMLSFAVAELHPETKEIIEPEINECFYKYYQDIVKKK